ncbi:MAG: cyclase family protein [Proteobacteria bacterium]|nr:cyclase family protein [Pseudomonadota bacterium]
MNCLEFTAGGRRWRADVSASADLAIELEFNGAQPSFFVATPASSEPLRIGGFTGSVATGASCNCAVHSLAPHCHGTHTECVGHVTRSPVTIASLTPVAPCVAMVVSVRTEPLGAAAAALAGGHAAAEDLVIRRDAIEAAASAWLAAPCTAVVIRTLPNGADKRHRAYSGSPSPAPYFLPEAMRWLVERGVNSLVVDLPSLDRADDGGRLAAHREYWGLPPGCEDAAQATRGQALVTELAYVPDSVPDGLYLLDLQVPAFGSDAAPSRPVLYPLQSLPGDAT